MTAVTGRFSAARQRRLAAIVATDCPVVIEACAGSDVAALVAELIEAEPDRWRIEEAVEGLAARLEAVEAEGDRQERQLLVTGRVVDDALIGALGRCLQLREPDLWLTTQEVGALLGSDADSSEVSPHVAAVATLTGGWPAAIDGIVNYSPDGAQPDDLSAVVDVAHNHPGRFGILADEWVQGLSADDLWAISTLCALGRFDHQGAALLDASDALHHAVAHGLPVCREATGWITLPPIALVALNEATRFGGMELSGANDAEARDKRLRSCLEYLDRRGELERCIDFCLQTGRHDLAVELVGDAHVDICSRVKPATLRAQLVMLEPDYTTRPYLALAASSVGICLDDPDLTQRPLEAALAGINKKDPDLVEPVSREVAAQLALQLGLLGDFEPGEDLLVRLRRSAAPDADAAHTARLSEAEVVHSLRELTDERLHLARSTMTDAIAMWRRLGRMADAAEATRRLVSIVLRSLGQPLDAMRALERSLADSLPSNQFAALELERARFLWDLGKAEKSEHAANAALRAATVTTASKVAIQSCELLAELASVRGDDALVADYFQQFEDHVGASRGTRLGGSLLGEFAISFARCGQAAAAESLLAELGSIAHADERELLWYRAWVSAYVEPGQAAVAHVDAFTSAVELPAALDWVVLTLKALAHRTSDPDHSRDCLARARDEASEATGVDRPMLIEGRIFGPLVATTPPDDDAVVEARDEWRIVVLDGFSVTHNGVPVEVAQGRQATLIKLIVLTQGYCTLDSAIDVLWPETDLATGRQRIRNVLTRMRASLGELIERDGELLRLAVNATCDLTDLRSDIGRILAASAPDSATVASTQARLAAELLPMNRYDDWLEPHSAELQWMRRTWSERFSNGRADDPRHAVVAAEVDLREIDGAIP